MSNVHSFQDMEVGQNNQPAGQVPDSLFDSFKQVFCPKFALRSITVFLIVANIAIFLLLEMYAWATSAVYECVLYQFGALYPPDLWTFQIHRLVMPAFLHFDFWHIATNVLSAVFLSFDPEIELGHTRYLILYFGSSVYGFMLSCVGHPTYLTAGASAAIMGLLGYFLVRMFFRLRNMDNRSYFAFLLLAGLNVIFMMMSPKGNVYAHLGGLAFGALFTLMHSEVSVQDYPSIVSWKYWAKMTIIAYPVVVILIFLVRHVKGNMIC